LTPRGNFKLTWSSAGGTRHDGRRVPGPPMPQDPTQNFGIDSDPGAERRRRAPSPHFKFKPLASTRTSAQPESESTARARGRALGGAAAGCLSRAARIDEARAGRAARGARAALARLACLCAPRFSSRGREARGAAKRVLRREARTRPEHRRLGAPGPTSDCQVAAGSGTPGQHSEIHFWAL
jgi:hypothetical protein